MKFIKGFFVTIFVLFLIIVVGGYFFIKNLDLNKYSSKIVDVVEKQTGRKFKLGSIDVKMSLIPTLLIKDVSLSNASWANDASMIEAKSIELQIALKPLIDKEFIIKNFVLDEAKIYLQTNEYGVGNWVFDVERQTPKTTFKFELVSSAYAAQKIEIPNIGLENISINNGFVSFNEHKLGVNTFSLSMPNKDSQIKAIFDVVYNDESIKGSSTTGSLNNLLEEKLPYFVDLSLESKGVKADFVGNVKDMLIEGKLSAYSPEHNLNLPEIALESDVKASFKEVSLDITSLSIAKNIIEGRVNANLEKKPFIDAYLTTNAFDLQMLEAKKSTLRMPSLISAAHATKLVEATPINYDVLNIVDAKLNFDVKNLTINKEISFDKLVATANLSDGVLLIKPLEIDIKEGKIFATASVDAKTQTMNANIETNNLVLQSLDKEFLIEDAKDFGIKSGGVVDLYANVVSSGGDVKELVEGLNGRVVAIANQSVVQTGNSAFLGGFLGTVLNAIKLGNVDKNKEVDLTCAVIRTDIKNGVLNFPKGIAVQSNDLSVVANGYVSLGNDSISLDLHPYVKDIVNASIASSLGGFIKVKGTIEKPQIVLDEKQALKTIVGVLTTGAATAIAEQVSDSSSSPCYSALIGTGHENKFPKPAVVNRVYEDSSKTVDKSVKQIKSIGKDLGKNLGNLLKSF